MNVMPAPNPTLGNIRTLVSYVVPLCVECPAYGRHALLEAEMLALHSDVSDMESRPVIAPRLRC
jgi:hypothetical protein